MNIIKDICFFLGAFILSVVTTSAQIGMAPWQARYGGSPVASSTWIAAQCGAGITLSNGNLTASKSSGSAWTSCRSSPTGHASGKWYFEQNITAKDGSNGVISGFMNASGPTGSYTGSDANSIGNQFVGLGDIYYSGTQHASAGCTSLSNVVPIRVGWAINVGVEAWLTCDGTTWKPGGNPTSAGTGYTYPASISGAVYPAISLLGGGAADTATLAVISSQYSYTRPTGYSSWN